MGHFYDINGNPRYEAGLKQAREENLLPSVTTIDKVISNEGINQYLINQAIDSALTLPKLETESLDDFKKRVKVDMKQHSRKAAVFGNVVHKLLERWVSGKPLFFKGNRTDVWIAFNSAKSHLETLDLTFSLTEKVLVNKSMGYAGKADLINLDVIIDYKTQWIDNPGMLKSGKGEKKAKVNFYDSWCRQLAALKNTPFFTSNKVSPICESLVISSNPDYPGVWRKVWTDEELDSAFECFISARVIYKELYNL